MSLSWLNKINLHHLFDIYKFLTGGVIGLAIIAFVVLQLVGFFSMGGESYWILNDDNAYRLTHAWQVYFSTSYPPPSLSNIDLAYHYHYGGPAIATFFAKAFNLPVDLVYFRLVLPVAFIFSLGFVYIVVFNKTKNVFISVLCVSIAIMACLNTVVDLENLKLWKWMKSSLYSFLMTVWHFDIDHVLDSATTQYSFWYGNKIYDISYLVLFLSMGAVLSLFIVESQIKRLALLLLLLMVFLFMKTEVVFWLFLLVFVEMFFLVGKYARFGWIVAFIAFLFLVFISTEGNFFLGDTKVSLFYLENNEISFLEWFSFFLYFLILIDVAFLIFLSKKENKYLFFYLLLNFLFFLYVEFFDISLTIDGQVTEFSRHLVAVSHAMYAVGVIAYIFSINTHRSENRSKFSYILFSFVLLLIAVGSFFKGGHAMLQTWILVSSPNESYKVVDLSNQRECMSHIPRKDTVVYTNTFEEWPPETKTSAMHLTSFFGHQGFATNYTYERYDVVKERIKKQKETLGRSNTSIRDVCGLVADNGYAYISKKYEYALSLERGFIFENKDCAVFNANKNICFP